jgi:arsenate reductase-like glutaredoxin family protein
LLGDKGVPVQERLYFKQKPTVEEVRALAAKLPHGPWDILSTRSRKYKELGLAERELTEEELIKLLAAEPGLWRRPIVIRGDDVVIGYDAVRLQALLSGETGAYR